MVRGEGSLFFATRRGVDFLRLAVPPATTPAPTWWAHDTACAWLAAWYSVRGRSFLGPRELLNSRKWLGALEWMDRDSFKQSGHRPDLVGYGPVGTVAFEVELAPKSKPRLDAIMCLHQDWLLAGQSKRVVYICGDQQGVRRINAAAQRAAPLMLESKALQLVLLHKIKGTRDRALRSSSRHGRRAAGDNGSLLSTYGTTPYTQVVATTAKTRRIEIRVTEDEHTLEEAAATALGISLSEFYRRAARESAEEVLAERSSIVLNEAEAERFLDALEHPERFEVGMARLAARPSVIPKS